MCVFYMCGFCIKTIRRLVLQALSVLQQDLAHCRRKQISSLEAASRMTMVETMCLILGHLLSI